MVAIWKHWFNGDFIECKRDIWDTDDDHGQNDLKMRLFNDLLIIGRQLTLCNVDGMFWYCKPNYEEGVDMKNPFVIVCILGKKDL